MGSLVGLGIPYMFNVESRPLLFGSMLAGSTVGGGLAIYLTRYIPSHGANVENLSFSGSLIEINGKNFPQEFLYPFRKPGETVELQG